MTTHPWPRTLLGAVSSLIVWAVYFVLVYALVGVGCDAGWHERTLAGRNLLTLSLIAVTVPTLGLIAWIGWAGWRGQKSVPGAGSADEAVRRWGFLSLLTIAAALLAFIATFMTALPSLMLPPCEI